jgi:AGZA family xanthine/uracil permease-like MFS transporter
VATIIAALFGSPFGMTVFIGHPGFKKMGAKIGYNILCAVCFVIVCFSGLAGLFKAIFPPQALNPILLFVGLAICCDAMEVTPQRHWPALMLALVPGFCNWASTQAQNFAAGICNQPGSKCVVNPSDPGAWTLDTSGDLRGLYALGQGYLLTSIFLTSMLIFVIDRKFAWAAVWAFVAAVSSAIGLIHSGSIFLPWVGPARPEAGSIYNPDQFDLHWHFFGAYMGLCALFLACFGLQHLGQLQKPHVEEESGTPRSFVESVAAIGNSDSPVTVG